MSIHPLPQIAVEEEAQLVERARQGDPDAFGTLVEPWRRPLFGYIYRMVTHRQDAEDLLQDALVRAMESIRKFRGQGAASRAGCSASPPTSASTTSAAGNAGGWKRNYSRSRRRTQTRRCRKEWVP